MAGGAYLFAKLINCQLKTLQIIIFKSGMRLLPDFYWVAAVTPIRKTTFSSDTMATWPSPC